MGWNPQTKRNLAIAAAVVGLHACVTAAVYLTGSGTPQPRLFPDTLKYQNQIVLLADTLADSGAGAWLFALVPLHVKLYSLCFLLFGRWADFSILSIEPLNALYYLATLYLVFKLSRQVFGPETSLLAAVVVGLWPSFLLHTTQPLRDPLFVVLALLFLLINLLWLTKDYSVRKALMVSTLGAVAESALWVTRSDMWDLMVGIALLTCCLLAVRFSTQRKVVWGNVVGAALLVVIGVLIPRAALPLYGPVYSTAESYGVASLGRDDGAPGVSESRPLVGAGLLARASLTERIAGLRERFALSYPGAGSNIDTEVRFHDAADVVGYLPRAMLVGLFAPFPRMWFAPGAQNGRLGRTVAGAETLALYVIELMAAVGLWHKRREPAAWFLLLVPVAGATALGLVVTNVGALYRMRYVFVMLLVILASEGVRRVMRRASSETGPQVESRA